MCGICGVFGRGDSATVTSMLDTIIHRGPDDGFQVGGEDFALGVRRLSIVDVTGGRQPLCNETGTVWAAQNGELYNYPEAYPQLRARGHQLHTTCDTEMLPHLYEDYGMRLPEHIQGMFAVAVWDDAEKIGLLARDRMGQKPLYYYQDGEALYFASEIKALLCIPGFERRINLEALHHYLSYKHVPNPMSIFEGVRILPPAHRLIFRPGHEPKIERYWDVDFATTDEMANITEEDAVEEFLRLMRQGVKRRLMSDVPIGFFLSGGIDSSLSTALAAEMAGTIQTFTLTYGDDSTTAGKEEDRRWARWVADHYDTEHREETIEFANFPESIGPILRCFDEPFAGVVSTYYLSRLISQHVKVALAGDAADELFGSYRSHRLAFPLSNFPEYVRTGDENLIRPWEDQQEYLAQLAEYDDWEWRYKSYVYEDEEKASLYNLEVAETMRDFSTADHVRHHDFANLTATDPLNRILEAEYRTIFPDQVLAFVDRLSMAHSLEVRTAYLDTDLVEFVAALPGRLKINNGVTKYLLKKASARYFPEEMAFRPKEGFLMPITEWIINDLEAYVRDTLSPARLKKHGIFDAGRVQALIDGLYQNESDYMYVNKILGLLIFQEWYELYME
jgi:asparagine synthase (glutamine-hydrolysing)